MTSPEKLATPEINHASAETAKVLEHAIGALADILGGWRYIRQSHGDLYGVGWDRCEKSASIAIAALRTEVEALATQRQGEGETQPDKKLWLWKNFVDGRPEYWAFDNPYPCRMDCWDPQTLGEPCGYALFKPSREGRTDWTEEKVLHAIKNARPAKE